jgi:hypothetical protein
MTDTFTQVLTGSSAAGLVLSLVAFGIGYIAGTLHFRSLGGVARRIVTGDVTAVALQIGRLAGLTAVLLCLALFGASTLIAGAAGILLARARVLARLRVEP